MRHVQILFSRSILMAVGAAMAGGLAFSSSQSPAAADPQRCNPIGRITQGSGFNFREGDIICLGQQVQSRETAKLLCFANFKEVTLPSGTVVVDRRICGLEGSSVQTRDCAQAQQCFYPKGTEEAAFAILQPQAGLIASARDLETSK